MFPQFWPKIEDKLNEYGLEKRDLGKFAGCYTIISTSIMIGTTAILYRYKPFQAIRNNSRFQARFPFVERWDQKFHRLKPVQWISENVSYKPKEFSKALVESMILNKICSPIVTPLELGGTIYVVKKWKDFKDSGEKN